jgi:hypothetical protein
MQRNSWYPKKERRKGGNRGKGEGRRKKNNLYKDVLRCAI